MVLLLLQQGALPNNTRSDYKTPLTIAADWKLFTIATLLVTYGADPDIISPQSHRIYSDLRLKHHAQAIDFCHDHENKFLLQKAINDGFIKKKKKIRPLLDQYFPVVLRNIVEEYSHEHYALKAQPTPS